VEIYSRAFATGYELEPQVVETKTLVEEQQQYLHHNPQVPGNVETPVADRNRRRQTPESSAQNPDYEPPNSPRSRRQLTIAATAPGVVPRYSCRRTLLYRGQHDMKC
jgi:hypothetical protein